MRTLFKIIAAGALVAGCAGPQLNWYKDGKPGSLQETWQSDVYGCKRDIMHSPVVVSRSVAAPTIIRAMAIECMESKGYRRG